MSLLLISVLFFFLDTFKINAVLQTSFPIPVCFRLVVQKSICVQSTRLLGVLWLDSDPSHLDLLSCFCAYGNQQPGLSNTPTSADFRSTTKTQRGRTCCVLIISHPKCSLRKALIRPVDGQRLLWILYPFKSSLPSFESNVYARRGCGRACTYTPLTIHMISCVGNSLVRIEQ